MQKTEISRGCSLMNEPVFPCERMQVHVKTGISETGGEWREVKLAVYLKTLQAKLCQRIWY